MAVSLLSCEKEIDNETQVSNEPHHKLMEVEFYGEVFANSTTIQVNGSEITSTSANVNEGDIISIEAYNSCTSNGCPLMKVIIYIDGVKEVEEYCTCEVINYQYIIE